MTHINKGIHLEKLWEAIGWILRSKRSCKCSKTIFKGSLVEWCNNWMKTDLKKSKENSKFGMSWNIVRSSGKGRTNVRDETLKHWWFQMKLGPGIGGKSLDNTCILFNMTLGKTPSKTTPQRLRSLTSCYWRGYPFSDQSRWDFLTSSPQRIIGWSALSKLQKSIESIELGISIFEVHRKSEDEVTWAWGPLSFS